MSLNQVLVATDLTERSDRALSRALQLGTGALTVLHVVPAGLPPELTDEQRRASEAFLASHLKLWKELVTAAVLF
jgi:nucleotide-binding universal stress UspA family protein